MKLILNKRWIAVAASVLLMAASGTAHAVITAGGASIHNAATLTFSGGKVTASVNVAVKTIAAIPTISVNSVAQSVNAGQTASYIYTIRNNANGSDVITLTGASVDANTTGAATLTVPTSVTLGGSITSQANTVGNTIVIPAGSEVNLAAGDTINVGGTTYTIAAGGVAPGTIASTTGTVTTPETPTVITVVETIAVGAVPAGTQVGEIQTFSVPVVVSSPTTPGIDGTHTVNLTAITTATTQGAAPAAITYITSAGDNNQTVTTVLSATISLVKSVRNVTQGVLTFATSGVDAKSGDTLEYRLVATETTGTSNATTSVLTDEVPVFTTYVTGSTQLNGASVVDGPLGTLKLTSANSGLQVNSPGAGAGVINAGASATVLFQVTVD